MKRAVLFAVALLFSLSLASALDITLTKESYYPLETLQAEIPDIFPNSLSLDNIGVYFEDNAHKNPAEAGLIRSGSKYLYYAVLPESPGTYKIKIQGVLHYEGIGTSSSEIIKQFTIASTNQSYISFSPGFVSATNDFNIKIRAYNSMQQIKVSFSEANFEQTFELGYGNLKTIYIPISSINSAVKSSITVNSYTIPAIISPPLYANITENNTNYTGDLSSADLDEIIKSDVKEIEATIKAGYDYYFRIYLENADEAVDDIKIESSNKEIKVAPENIEKLDRRMEINVTINTEKEIDGWINISREGKSILIPVALLLTEEDSNTSSNIEPINKKKTCASLNGRICNTSIETCSAASTLASDGLCCLGNCDKKEDSSSTWMWGLLILVVLALVGWLLYQKSKKSPYTEAKSAEYLKKKAEDYEKRFKPVPPPVEVRKSLDKS